MNDLEKNQDQRGRGSFTLKEVVGEQGSLRRVRGRQELSKCSIKQNECPTKGMCSNAGGVAKDEVGPGQARLKKPGLELLT